jgi:hypothetical protein
MALSVSSYPRLSPSRARWRPIAGRQRSTRGATAGYSASRLGSSSIPVCQISSTSGRRQRDERHQFGAVVQAPADEAQPLHLPNSAAAFTGDGIPDDSLWPPPPRSTATRASDLLLPMERNYFFPGLNPEPVSQPRAIPQLLFLRN